jgi:hypothetical protein
VNLLAATCVVRDMPIVSNQQLITELLFSKSSLHVSSTDRLVMQLRLNQFASVPVVEVVPVLEFFGDSPVSWMPLSQFLQECEASLFG